MRKQAMQMGHKLSLDKQIGKGGMRDVRRQRRKHNLRIGGNLDFLRKQPIVGQTQAANFRIVLGRYDDFQGAGDATVGAGDADTVFDKDRFVLIGFLHGWLIPG